MCQCIFTCLLTLKLHYSLNLNNVSGLVNYFEGFFHPACTFLPYQTSRVTTLLLIPCSLNRAAHLIDTSDSVDTEYILTRKRLWENKLFSIKSWISNSLINIVSWPSLSFSSCQWNLIKTFQIESLIAPITKMTLSFSSDLLNGQK